MPGEPIIRVVLAKGMLPGGIAAQMREHGKQPGKTEGLIVTVLMSPALVKGRQTPVGASRTGSAPA